MKLATRSWGEEGRRLALLTYEVVASSRIRWKVGPWFAENGWRAVAVDLRGHGESPRAEYGVPLADLTNNLYETALGLLKSNMEGIDILLVHSLGTLNALKLCQKHDDLVGRLVLE